MLKRFLVFILAAGILTGCTAAAQRGGAGPTAQPVASAAPRTITVKGRFAGLTQSGWVRVQVPSTPTVLELELQKEVKPQFEAMKLQAGEEVWVHYYQEVPRIAGIARTTTVSDATTNGPLFPADLQYQSCGQETNIHGQGYDPKARDCLWQGYSAARPTEFTSINYTTEGNPITYQVRVVAAGDVRVLVDSKDKFGAQGQFKYGCASLERIEQKYYTAEQRYNFSLTGCTGSGSATELGF